MGHSISPPARVDPGCGGSETMEQARATRSKWCVDVAGQRPNASTSWSILSTAPGRDDPVGDAGERRSGQPSARTVVSSAELGQQRVQPQRA